MVTDILEKILSNVFSKLGYNIKAKVIISNRKELCDYQCDDAFKLAKEYRKNPVEIGNSIINELKNISKYDYYFEDVSFINPGFINMKLGNVFINDLIRNMATKDKFGIKKPNDKQTFILDYGGYNIAKPLHIGHLRPTIIGESIKRIIDYMGHKTISDVHLGDFGLQMGQVIYGIKRDNINIEDIDIEYLNKIYPEISSMCKSDSSIKKECERITKQLQDGNVEYQTIWEKIYEVSINDAKSICKYLNVSFDLWQGESDANKYLEEVENLLNEKGLLEESEGALVINVKNDTDNKPMPPVVFKKSNGGYLYESTDLATIYERVQKYNPDHIIYVTDFRQNLHFEQIFRTSSLAGLISYKALEHAYNGTINGTDGKPFKTRKGDAPKLGELFKLIKETFINLKEVNQEMDENDLDIIVNAIIKFADLGNARDKDYIFDINKFSNVTGRTGPYILYTYLRINKIIDNQEIKELSNNIYNNVDRNLRLKLLEFESSLTSAFNNRMPSYIADYIYNVAVLANNFYQSNHINGLDDEIKKNDWVYILNLTNRILKEMLNLIIIDIPKIM